MPKPEYLHRICIGINCHRLLPADQLVQRQFLQCRILPIGELMELLNEVGSGFLACKESVALAPLFVPPRHVGFLALGLIDSVYFHSPYTLPEHPANHRSNQINRNPNRNRDRVSDVDLFAAKTSSDLDLETRFASAISASLRRFGFFVMHPPFSLCFRERFSTESWRSAKNLDTGHHPVTKNSFKNPS